MRGICTDNPPTKMVKPCEICGDDSVPEAIIICSRCKSTREHLYCMRVVRTDVPQFWDCDECVRNKPVSPKSTITKQTPEASKKRVPTFMQKSPKVNEGQNKNVLPNRFNFKEKSVDTGKTKYISCDEVAKLSSGANKLKCSPRKESRSSHVIPRSMPPPRERTPIKSPQIVRGSNSESDLQKLVGKPPTGPKVTFCESPKISKRIETTSIERKPKKVNFEVPSPIIVETDVAMDVEVAKSPQIERGSNSESDLQKHADKPSTGLKATFCESPKISKRIETSIERKPKKVNFEVPSPITVETDVAMDVEVAKSPQIERGGNSESDLQKLVGKPSTGPKVTFCESPNISKRVETTSIERESKKVNFEVLSPITVETDVAMDVKVAKSSEILAKTGIQSGTTMGSKNDADLGARNSDGGKPMLPSALVVCETFGPYIPALNSYWKGSFTLPHGLGNFDNIFLAHPPSRVHNKVYETIVKMPEEICFKLAPNDVYMELFSGSLPDKDDIGLYFFPSFSHRSEESMPMSDFLWSKNLMMCSLVNGVELLVFSSKLLKPSLQEFQGKCFLWGVFRCRKNKKLVIEAPVLMEDKSEPCDDAPPGFESVAAAPLLSEVKEEVCDDVPPGFEPIWKPKR